MVGFREGMIARESAGVDVLLPQCGLRAAASLATIRFSHRS